MEVFSNGLRPTVVAGCDGRWWRRLLEEKEKGGRKKKRELGPHSAHSSEGVCGAPS
jgi:hypothetical protein